MGIDYISMFASIDPIYSINSIDPFEWNTFWFKPLFVKREGVIIKGFESDYKGLRIFVNNYRVQISNSLHKFYKGNNFSDFSFSEMQNAIDEICNKMQIEADCWQIQKLEFGFNIIMPQAAIKYLDCITSFKNRGFEKMMNKHIAYGRKCFLSEYAVKIYDKSAQTKLKDKVCIDNRMLRIEIVYTQKRKLPIGIKTLANLKESKNMKLLNNELRSIVGKMSFKEQLDFANSKPEQRLLYFASLNPKFIEVEKEINKSHINEIKLKIKEVKERYSKNELKKIILKALSDKYIELYCN